MFIGMTPFRASYGYDALSFVDLVFADSRVLGEKDLVTQSQDMLGMLKENIQHAQNQRKFYVDQHRVERTFDS